MEINNWFNQKLDLNIKKDFLPTAEEAQNVRISQLMDTIVNEVRREDSDLNITNKNDIRAVIINLHTLHELKYETMTSTQKTWLSFKKALGITHTTTYEEIEKFKETLLETVSLK